MTPLSAPQQTDMKRKHRAKAKEVPPTIPLPTFHATPSPSDSPVHDVTVLPLPTMEERSGLTWVVDTRPRRQLESLCYIRLRVGTLSTGVGRLGQVVMLRRHWVTFAVSDAPAYCTLRVPIPWAKLNDLASVAHTSHFFDLPKLPRPHPSFRDIPHFENDEENPYEFEIWDDEIPDIESRLERIKNAPRSLRNRHPSCHRSTERAPEGESNDTRTSGM
ncbi:uncharacterized protein B0H18DRAFT_422877 [Fomitopsis serialis]|uniref:uncharacterized protein n=1 Tax=Fomitopsis serialis TaxID=139415 RepID=UPI002007F785|nr:uncharacterized protein B0H18DRAFT_422877 [Neoantrodia serialis]KAH9935768.1 hypothetical protein B0H18DRAFT_422877 [Neoantrodia serialis]